MITLDLGSNTLRILEFDCKTKRRVQEFEKVVRTAKDIHKTGVIAEDSIQRILEALKVASLKFDFLSQPTFAVTTEAMRQAKNSKEVLKVIKKRFGIEFKIIDGEEEARLTLVGIEHGLNEANLEVEEYVMMDLGGASTEISFIKGSYKISRSFSFGIVTTAERFGNLENIEKNIPNLLTCIDSFMHEKLIGVGKNTKFVATAGTPTSVAAFLEGIDYRSYSYEKINGKTLHVNDFRRALEGLLKLTPDEQEFWVGTNRSDLVCAGILIVEEIMHKFGFSECIVIDNGLREGLAISKCNTMAIN